MTESADLRGYAAAVLERGRAAVNAAGGAVQTATGRITTLVEDAPRPSKLVLGLADVAAQQVSQRAEAATRRVEHLPLEAVGGYSRAQSVTRARLTKAQEDAASAVVKAQQDALTAFAALRRKAPAGPKFPVVPLVDPAAARSAARHALHGYVEKASSAYESLAARGEVRAAALESDERIGRIVHRMDAGAESVQAHLVPILTKLSGTLEAIVARTATAEATTAPAVTVPAAAEAKPRSAKIAPPRVATSPVKATPPATAATPMEQPASARPMRGLAKPVKNSAPRNRPSKKAPPKLEPPLG